MVEQGSYYEPFEKLTPPELNKMFKQLLDQFPAFSLDLPPLVIGPALGPSEDDIAKIMAISEMEKQERRSRPTNVHKKLLLSRIQGFLTRFAYAPPSFNVLIINELNSFYDIGIVKGSRHSSESFFDHLLDLNKSESGGLFDPERAPRVILNSYKFLKTENDMIAKLLTEATKHDYGDEANDTDRCLGGQTEGSQPDTSELLARFEQEYFGDNSFYF